jgi:hypothetical protein
LQGVSPQPGAQAAGLRMGSGQMVAGVIQGQGGQTLTRPHMPLGESQEPPGKRPRLKLMATGALECCRMVPDRGGRGTGRSNEPPLAPSNAYLPAVTHQHSGRTACDLTSCLGALGEGGRRPALPTGGLPCSLPLGSVEKSNTPLSKEGRPRHHRSCPHGPALSGSVRFSLTCVRHGG